MAQDWLQKPWPECPIIGIDLETSGRYPLEGEICEMAAVKWQNGQIVERFQTLVKPKRVMSAEVIGIHNITNEMVTDAPPIEETVHQFHKFVGDSILIAHHAPFDMGFLTWEFERAKLPFPPHPVLCSSLMSRQVNNRVENHRLLTLIKHFGIQADTLHRALADAEACVKVAVKMFEKLGTAKTVADLVRHQGKSLYWQDYSLDDIAHSEVHGPMVNACLNRSMVNLVYEGGSRPGEARKVVAIGIVRNPDGDFFVGREENQDQSKRYFIDRIREVTAVEA